MAELLSPKTIWLLKLDADAALADVISAINDLGMARMVEKGQKPGESKGWKFTRDLTIQDQLQMIEAQKKQVSGLIAKP